MPNLSQRNLNGRKPSADWSNAEGEFQFQGLLPGKYTIYPINGRASGYFDDPALCEITDGAVDGVEIKLGTGGSVSGTVIIEGANDPLFLQPGQAYYKYA